MDDLFIRGIEEFNRQYFFEAHDLWEELWRETTGECRVFYQGLIQTAVGYYHFSNDNFKGAGSQWGKALEKLEHYLPSFHGLDTQQLVGTVRQSLAEVEAYRERGGTMSGKPVMPPQMWPQIVWST